MPVDRNACGGTLHTIPGTVSYVSSAGYGDYYIDCEWTIMSPDHSPVEMKFLHMNIMETPQCSEYYLEVKETF